MSAAADCKTSSEAKLHGFWRSQLQSGLFIGPNRSLACWLQGRMHKQQLFELQCAD
jgi:hypothetical protein